MFIYQKLKVLEKEILELKERIIKLEQPEQEDNDYDNALDPLFEKAKEAVIIYKKASSSFLMRRLDTGYARSAKIMDQLEKAGVVGPADGSKPRKVLITKYEPEIEE